MPEALRKFLRRIDDQTANEIWKWLDEEPDAITIMIGVIVRAHPSGHNRINLAVEGSDN